MLRYLLYLYASITEFICIENCKDAVAEQLATKQQITSESQEGYATSLNMNELITRKVSMTTLFLLKCYYFHADT